MPRSCCIIKCTGEEIGSAPLHKVPENDSLEREKWLQFIRTANDSMVWRETKHLYICDEHFDSSGDVSSDHPSKRKIMQRPTLVYGKPVYEFLEEKDDTDSLFGECCCSEKLNEQDKIIQLRDELNAKDEIILDFKQKLLAARNEVRVLKQKICRQISRTEGTQELTKQDATQPQDKDQETDVMKIITSELLCRLEKPNCRFSDSVKEFAFQLHFYSRRAYQYFRHVFHNTLPHPRSFLLWTAHLNTEPGFLQCSFDFLKKRNEESNSKTYYSLSFDEIHIRKQIVYHNHTFKGYVNYGGIMQEPMTDKEATAALFVMATEINGNLRLPIAYVLTNGLPTPLLSTIIKACIVRMTNVQASILTISFDGLKANFKSAKNLGANLDVDNEKYKSYIPHPDPQNLSKIYVIPDPSHMLKLLRNTFQHFKLMKDESGRIIHWKYIEALHQLQLSEGLRAANKLTSRHVNFQNQKMKTKLCTQLLSNSLSIAIGVCRELDLDAFSDSEGTETFLATLDRLFDCLNSRPYGYKAPLMQSNSTFWEPFLVSCIPYLKGLKIYVGNCFVPLHETTRGTPITGLVTSIASILGIMKEPEVMQHIIALPTYRLSQDMLELFFSAIRSRFGFNNNPNCVQLQFALKGLLCMKMETKFNGNCNALEDIPSKISSLGNLNAAMNQDIEREETDDPIDESFLLPEISTFGLNIVFYISGSVSRKLFSKLKCPKCILLVLPSEKEIVQLTAYSTLFHMKDNGGLVLSSLIIFDVCKLIEQVIRKLQLNGLKSLKKDNVLSTVTAEVQRESILPRLRCSSDDDHSLEFLKCITEHYVIVRFYHMAKKTTYKLNPTSNRAVCTKSVIFSGN